MGWDGMGDGIGWNGMEWGMIDGVGWDGRWDALKGQYHRDFAFLVKTNINIYIVWNLLVPFQISDKQPCQFQKKIVATSPHQSSTHPVILMSKWHTLVL